jgi:opacity protein-like surface antigen
MNKALVAATLLGCGALASLPAAVAADVDNPDGFYVGGGFGQFNLDIDNFDQAEDAAENIADSDDNSWKVFAGYRINPYFALEAAYIDLGAPGDQFETSGTRGNYRAEIAGFSPAVIGSLPLGPVELFGKVGYYFYDVDLRLDLDGDDPAVDGVDSSHSESDFTYGLGVGLTLFEHLHARVEYEILDLDDAPNSNALWLSAAWRF